MRKSRESGRGFGFDEEIWVRFPTFESASIFLNLAIPPLVGVAVGIMTVLEASIIVKMTNVR